MKPTLLIAGMLAVSIAAPAAEMSGAEIIKKSEAAYAALKSYVGTTTVRGKTETAGMKLEQVSMAKVSFQRPGKIRIEGKTASMPGAHREGSPFTIVSDGKTTWKSWALQKNGAFEPVTSVAGAGTAGVAQGAAEAIPSALMKSDGAWTGGSDPFAVPRLAGAKLEGHETIDGADCFKIVSKSPTLGDVTVWIDSKTFLMRQMMRELGEKQIADQRQAAEAAMKRMGKDSPLPANTPVPKSMSHVFSFKNDQLTGKLDDHLFADPTKK